MDRMSIGLNSNEWHSMSDERRAQFMRDKRKLEAFKTEMCKGFIRVGNCRYGPECRFAHDQSELRLRPMHPKYKTELCLNFSRSGQCGYGSRCQFIHRSPDQGRSRSVSGSAHLGGYSAAPNSMEFHRSLQPSSLSNNHRSASVGYNNFFQSYQRQEIMQQHSRPNLQQQLQSQVLSRLYSDYFSSMSKSALLNGNGCGSPQCPNGETHSDKSHVNGNGVAMPQDNASAVQHFDSNGGATQNGFSSQNEGSKVVGNPLAMPSPSRFAMSAYVKRDRHPALQPRPKLNGNRNVMERESPFDINSMMSLITETNGNKPSEFESEDWITAASADLSQWHPFSERALFNEDVQPNSNSSSTGISQTLSGSNST